MAQVPVYPSRAQKEPTTAQAELPASHNNYQDCKKYIKKALQAHTENTNFGQQVERRALIIAPQYKDYEEGMHLPATALDIHLVHKMLVEFGYEPENIRILCDVCPGSGNSYPTKTNIINGLKWLVKESDLTPNAFRFLHFSGHGVRISSSDQTGPGKRIKDSDWKPEMTPVTQDSERSSSQMFAGRITTQKVLLDAELKYYNEGILTRKDVSDEKEPINLILDSKLNKYLSKLPPDCTITCTLDCCASGRMLNLDKKVAGSGWRAAWRGRPIAPVAAGSIISTSISSPQDTSALPFKEGASESDQPLSMGISKLSMKDLPKIQTEHEDLPHAEKAMNNVVAKIFSWSASHQRQEAWNDGENITGLFTRIFTETCLRSKGSQDFTYRSLHDQVSREVTQQRQASSRAKDVPSRPQFVQLWTSSKGRDQNTKDDLLDSNVVF